MLTFDENQIAKATAQIRFDLSPLVPAVIQDVSTSQVLMVAFMNEESFQLTLRTGNTHFDSRSRSTIWKKGETSGNVQEVDSISINCESNSLLVQVHQRSAVCHNGYRSCHYRELDDAGSFEIAMERSFDPELVYGAGSDRISALVVGV